MTRPLAGIRILITRPRDQASSLAAQLQAHGAEIILIPAIEIAPPEDPAPLEFALTHLDQFDWAVFTSSNAAEVFASRVNNQGRLPKIAAVGPATAAILAKQGLPVHLIPHAYTAQALAEALTPHAAGTRMLLLRAAVAPNLLPQMLAHAGAEVTTVEAYRNIVPAATRAALTEIFRDPGQHPQAITFTSASTAVNLVHALQQSGLVLPETIARASIGPVTSQALAELGFPATLEAPEATIPSLVAAIVQQFQTRPR